MALGLPAEVIDMKDYDPDDQLAEEVREREATRGSQLLNHNCFPFKKSSSSVMLQLSCSFTASSQRINVLHKSGSSEESWIIFISAPFLFGGHTHCVVH